MGVFLGGLYQKMLLLPAVILALAGAYCYWFWSPVAYEQDNNALTVFFRASSKTFPAVRRCSTVEQSFPIWTSFRLCGNGGVFAGSGIFWNRRYGVFRAYVTRSKPPELVLVETEKRKIVISPADPQGFVQSAPLG